MPSDSQTTDELTLLYHMAMPNWCMIDGLKIKAVPQCEGGGFMVDRKQAEALIAMRADNNRMCEALSEIANRSGIDRGAEWARARAKEGLGDND